MLLTQEPKLDRRKVYCLCKTNILSLEYWNDGIVEILNNKSQMTNIKQITMTKIQNPKKRTLDKRLSNIGIIKLT